MHGEFAVFDTPGDLPESGLFGGNEWRAKAVLGGSYTFDIGNGLTVLSEYHYSDFGLRDPSKAVRYLLDKDFQERYLRGDSQILGRHALGVQCLYIFNEWLTGSWLTLVSPTDFSGVVSPGLIWDFSQNASLRFAAFFPWGPGPNGVDLGSEYGAGPVTLFMQMSLYF